MDKAEEEDSLHTVIGWGGQHSKTIIIRRRRKDHTSAEHKHELP